MLEKLGDWSGSVLLGAAAGTAMLSRRLGNRSGWEKLLLLVGCFIGASLAGHAAAEYLTWGPATSGGLAWLAGNTLLHLTDGLVSLLGETSWLRRALGRRIAGSSDFGGLGSYDSGREYDMPPAEDQEPRP
ncbi:hypothetical protein N8I74_11130 [Chitiniphilus purpureus]|uniref:Uncharacterized protein n=1 Tax=Chitiniphilus purpureus TaxID=2981137 RepID=A0ABY6DHQ2_9NEIS|nr:hypothetical protein [Chitiniphilus sp. CD1]UXY13875.1 hypothetical protein N8I74_11130 [Chitiniphilus sp. CD1]